VSSGGICGGAVFMVLGGGAPTALNFAIWTFSPLQHHFLVHLDSIFKISKEYFFEILLEVYFIEKLVQ